MPDAATLRDSTQILLPTSTFEEVAERLESEFVVTTVEHDGDTRVIGSPAEIKRVNDFLARNGVSVR